MIVLRRWHGCYNSRLTHIPPSFSTLGDQFGRQGVEFANQTADLMPNSKTRRLFLESAYRGFSGADPAAAWDSVRPLESGKLKDILIQGVFEKRGETDPQSAIRLLSKVPDFNAPVHLTSSLIKKVANEDLAAAVDLVKRLPNADAREQALLRLISKISQSDFGMSAILVSALSSGPAKTYARKTIAGNDATRQPDAVIEWLNALPQDSERDAATAAMIGPIYLDDSTRATALALGLPHGADRERAIGIVARLASRAAPSPE